MATTYQLPLLGRVTRGYVFFLLLSVITFGAWCTLMFMLLNTGPSLQEVAFSSGQQGQLFVADGSVKGHFPTLEEQQPETQKTEETKTQKTKAQTSTPEPITDKAKEKIENSEKAEVKTPPNEIAEQVEKTQEQETVPFPETTQTSTQSESTQPQATEPAQETTTHIVHFPLALTQNTKLHETTDQGLTLPRVTNEGETPWQYYGKSDATAMSTPIIAIIVKSAGLNQARLDILNRYSEFLTLSFSPYARNLKKQIQSAREAGHEVWLDLPLQTNTYPADDPGPLAVLAETKPAEVDPKIHHLLSLSPFITGLVLPKHEVVSSSGILDDALNDVQNRGLLLMRPVRTEGETSKNPSILLAERSVTLTQDTSLTTIMSLFSDLEAIAANKGSVIAIIEDTPDLLEGLDKWVAGLKEKSLALVPASAIVMRRK